MKIIKNIYNEFMLENFFNFKCFFVSENIWNNISGIGKIYYLFIAMSIGLLIFSLLVKSREMTLLYILAIYILTAFFLITNNDIYQYLGFCVLFSYLGAILILFTFFIMMVYPRLKYNKYQWVSVYVFIFIISILFISHFIYLVIHLQNIYISNANISELLLNLKVEDTDAYSRAFDNIRDVQLLNNLVMLGDEEMYRIMLDYFVKLARIEIHNESISHLTNYNGIYNEIINIHENKHLNFSEFLLNLYTIYIIYFAIAGIALLIGTIICVMLLTRKIENTKHQDPSLQMLEKRDVLRKNKNKE